ncbi:MAG: hypothetical protein KDK65_06520 [Chlamydiia bacterium]|nr:hypothetical protein [Chlamydiia bacterium]
MHPLSVYLNLLKEEGIKPFLANVEACVDRIWWGNREVPLMVNEAQWDNAIVCSPYSFYIAYPQEIALPKWIQTIPKHLSALMK